MTLQAARVRVPLESLRQALRDRESRLRPPRIGAPVVGDEFELRPMREIALRELLAHADSGRARVHIPLAPAVLKKGPFKIEIPERAEAVINVEVEGGLILRDPERTRGTIEPDIGLPLGLKFRGIYLDEEGSIIADIAKFPNLNLSWLNVAKLRVPASLEEMLALMFENKSGPEEPEPSSEGTSLAVDLGGLRVEATEVVPRQAELSLGQLGSLLLGVESRFNVHYTQHLLSASGRVVIADAALAGTGFSLRGVQGRGEGTAALQRTEHDRRMTLKVRFEVASLEEASVELLDGSRIEFGASQVEGLELELSRVGGEIHWRLSAERLHGRVRGGILMTWIGGRPHAVRLSEADVVGAVTLDDDRGFQLDVEVSGARLELESLRIPLGIVDLDFGSVQATATGRLRAGRELGYAFSGQLAVTAALRAGSFDAGMVRARFLEGTTINLNVTRAGGNQRLHEVQASGTADLRLASGSLPLGPDSALTFSAGSTGTLALHNLELETGGEWVTLEAGMELSASTEPFLLGDALQFPAGSARLNVPRLTIDEDGHLCIEDANLTLASD